MAATLPKPQNLEAFRTQAVPSPAMDPANDPRSQQDYIFTLPPSDRPTQDKSVRNPKTSRIQEVEVEESFAELGYRVHELKDLSARALYGNALDMNKIDSFLETAESGYDTARGVWTTLPLDPVDESELRGPFVKLLNLITNHFNPPVKGNTREAVDSHEIPMVHDNGAHYTSPGISIKAGGPSFEVPDDAERSGGLGYTNVATVLDVRIDRLKGKRMVHCQRLATYSRQIFLQQPNRHFVRSLLVTEKVFRMVHEDRSGIYTTPLFDIHKGAKLFVQFVVGSMSPDEALIGLDTSVQWTIDETSGKKVSGTITLEEFDEDAGTSTTKVYDLDMNEAPFVRPGIRGRGTVGWNARDPVSGEPVLIKDAWRINSRESECEFLLEARGIPGVVEILGYQDFFSQTAQYRPPNYRTKEFHNRTKLRIVLKRYGAPVWFFRSRLQLLRALRDVLIGHCGLFKRGIIHRDISTLNTLLGLPGAPEGHRGCLIDLDMAAYVEDCKSSLPADPHIGTRMYQSTSVVRSLSITPSPPQDYMDDLESLFYVYSHLVYGFERPGVKKSGPVDVLDYWDLDDTSLVANAKVAFTLSPTDLMSIPPYWGEACTALLKEYHSVIRGIVEEKNAIHMNRHINAEEKLKAYDALAQNFNVYSERVEVAFNKAIAQLEKEGLNTEELEPYPHSFLAPHVLSSGSSEPPAPLSARLSTIPPLTAPLPQTGSRPHLLAAGKKRLPEDKGDYTPRKRFRDYAHEGPPCRL